MNDLNTILDQDGAKAEVQKWLVDSWLERQEYDCGLADSRFAKRLSLPKKSGQYLEVSRKGQPRRPQNLSITNPQSDPASGMLLSEQKVTVPIEFVQDYVGIGLVAGLTSRHDLEEWAKEDLPEAFRRRAHELTQNAMKVGRMAPGVWAADGTESTSFDASQEATVSMWGLSFTFLEAAHLFAGNKPSFAAMEAGDRICMADFERAGLFLKLNGAPKINGKYVAWISDSTKRELMKDERFERAVLAWNGKGLAENQIADFLGFHWMIDDYPFTENWGAANVRATFGPVHTSFVHGANSFAYLKLGGKDSIRPTFKIQDTTITGVYKTIGYNIPFQAAVVNANWCCTLTGPVSFYDPTNM